MVDAVNYFEKSIEKYCSILILRLVLHIIYLAGLNTGMYAATHDDDSVLDHNPFNSAWLTSRAEEATAVGFDETGDEYMLNALVKAILLGAGLSADEQQ